MMLTRTLLLLFLQITLAICTNTSYATTISPSKNEHHKQNSFDYEKKPIETVKNYAVNHAEKAQNNESDAETLAALSKPLRIPFRYTNGFLIVDIVLNQKLPLSFIFDTGSKHTILTEADYIPFLGQLPEEEIQIIGSDLTTPMTGRLMRRTSINIGEVTLENQSLILLDGNSLNLDVLTGEPIHGILGVGAFGAYGVKINYKLERIELLEHEAIRPSKKSTIHPIRIEQSKAYFDVEANILPGVAQKLSLLLDTGASLSMLVHTSRADTTLFPKKLVSGTFGYGLGGYLVGYVGRSDLVKLGPTELPDVVTHFQTTRDSNFFEDIPTREGIIGNGILDHFTILIDFTRSELHLQQVKKPKKKLAYDRSGMHLVRDGEKLNKIRVQHVSAGSPAYHAQVREGDEIIKIGGFPVGIRSLGGIENLLRGKVGKLVKLTIRRNDLVIQKSIRLKELI